MDTLKIGVVGTGHMGRNHVRVLCEDKRFECIGVYDINIDNAKEIAEKYQIAVFNAIESLLEEVDAVIIAVPSSLHKDVALKAAEYGVHALVEKPLATTSEDARAIVQTFNEKRLKLAVGHIERFNPVFRELKKITDPNSIFFVEACRYSPFSGSGRIKDTTVVEDLMIHDVDLICALMDSSITSIQGMGEAVASNQIDFATCVMDFNGHSHAVINASRVSQNKERSITVHADGCCIYADLLSKTLEIHNSTNLRIDLANDNSYKQEGIMQKVYVPIEEPLKKELVAFYYSVQAGEPIEVDGKVGLNAIAICEAVVKSIEGKTKGGN